MTEIISLTFADCVYIDESIFEIKPYQNIEVNAQRIDELHQALITLQCPISLLFSREKNYVFTPNALQMMMNIPSLFALGFYAKSQESYIETEKDLRPLQPFNVPTEIFTEKLVAVLWLTTKKLSGTEKNNTSRENLSLNAINHIISSEYSSNKKAIRGLKNTGNSN